MLYFLDRLAHARAAPYAGRVDEHELAAVALARHEDAVARRARLLRRDQPIRAEQPIDQRGLADVRPADHGDLRSVLLGERGLLGRGGRRVLRERPEHRLEKLVDAGAVQRAHADDGAETERMELGRRDLAERRPRPC